MLLLKKEVLTPSWCIELSENYDQGRGFFLLISTFMIRVTRRGHFPRISSHGLVERSERHVQMQEFECG